MYPNPVNNKIMLNTDTIIDRIEVYNSVGKKIMIKSCNGKKLISLRVSCLQNGLYFLKVIRDKRWIVLKFNKN